MYHPFRHSKLLHGANFVLIVFHGSQNGKQFFLLKHKLFGFVPWWRGL